MGGFIFHRIDVNRDLHSAITADIQNSSNSIRGLGPHHVDGRHSYIPAWRN